MPARRGGRLRPPSGWERHGQCHRNPSHAVLFLRFARLTATDLCSPAECPREPRGSPPEVSPNFRTVFSRYPVENSEATTWRNAAGGRSRPGRRGRRRNRGVAMIVVDDRNTLAEGSVRSCTASRFSQAAKKWRGLATLYSGGRRAIHNDHRRSSG